MKQESLLLHYFLWGEVAIKQLYSFFFFFFSLSLSVCLCLCFHLSCILLPPKSGAEVAIGSISCRTGGSTCVECPNVTNIFLYPHMCKTQVHIIIKEELLYWNIHIHKMITVVFLFQLWSQREEKMNKMICFTVFVLKFSIIISLIINIE